MDSLRALMYYATLPGQASIAATAEEAIMDGALRILTTICKAYISDMVSRVCAEPPYRYKRGGPRLYLRLPGEQVFRILKSLHLRGPTASRRSI